MKIACVTDNALPGHALYEQRCLSRNNVVQTEVATVASLDFLIMLVRSCSSKEGTEFFEQPRANTIVNDSERLKTIRFNRWYQTTEVAVMVDAKGGAEKLT